MYCFRGTEMCQATHFGIISVFLSPCFLFKDILHFSPSCCIFAEKFKIMIKKLYRHIAMRYKYWRYRRLLRKLFWFYAQKTDTAYLAMQEASQAFIWFTNGKDDSNGIVWYFYYHDSRASS